MYNFKKKFISTSCAIAILANAVNLPEMQFTSYAEEAQKPIVSRKASGWTFGIYMCGQNLEQDDACSTSNIIEILTADVPEDFNENNNVVIETGGCYGWHFKEKYGKYLKEKGLSEKEVNQIIPNEIDSTKLSQYKVNFKHEYIADDGTKKTVPALEWIKDVAEYNIDDADETKKTANMGDEYYLNEFMEELDKKYPSEHMVLDLWNHGLGICKGVCIDQYTDDTITLGELKHVLQNRMDAGYKKLDMICYDACLMSNYETWVNLSAYAEVGVGAVTKIPDYGWNYAKAFADLGKNYDNDSYDAKKFASEIVDGYKEYYTRGSRIYPDAIRRVMEEDLGLTVENAPEWVLDEIDEVFHTATLCAVDLEKIAKSSDKFNELSEDLLRAYVDDEGVKKIFKKTSDEGDLDPSADIVDMIELLKAIKDIAPDRIDTLSDQPTVYSMIASDAYKKLLSDVDEFKKQVSDSCINIYNGWENCGYNDSLGMSIYLPSYNDTVENADFGIDEYPDYAISDAYAKLAYLYAGKITKEDYESRLPVKNIAVNPKYSYDTKSGTYTISVTDEEKKGMYALSSSSYINVDGKNFLSNFEINNKVTHVEFKPANVYYTLNDKAPIDGWTSYCTDDAEVFNCNGLLNGKSGQFRFTKDSKGNYVFDEFIPTDDNFEFESIHELKVGDVITLTAKEAKEAKFFTAYTDEADENIKEIKLKDYVVSEKDYFDGERYTCNEDLEYELKSFKGYAPKLIMNEVFDEQIKVALGYIKYIDYKGGKAVDYKSEGRVYDNAKIKSLCNTKITIEKDEFELTGEAITPKVIVEDATLVEGKDYEVIYENNIGIGKGKAIVRGINETELAGERVIEFNIIKTTVNDKTVYVTVVVKQPKQVKLKSVKNSGEKSIKVKWKKIKGVNGYQIKYARNKKFTKAKKVKRIKDGKKCSYVLENLKKKTYYVKVRAYTIDPNGKRVYGDWSKVKKVKIKK